MAILSSRGKEYNLLSTILKGQDDPYYDKRGELAAKHDPMANAFRPGQVLTRVEVQLKGCAVPFKPEFPIWLTFSRILYLACARNNEFANRAGPVGAT
jgi:hypothetical protein